MNPNKPQPGVNVHSGFPNPATDDTLANLDINKLLIKHPLSTFFMQIEGHEWSKYGIFNGDIALIDRSLTPHQQDLVVYWSGSDFGIIKAHQLPSDTVIWGVVSSIIHRYRL